MDKKELMKLIESLEKTDWNKLEISEKGFTIKMERGITYAAPHLIPPVQAAVQVQPMAAAPQPVATAPVEAAKPEAPVPDADGEHINEQGKDIRSPLVGIFHRAGDIGVGSQLKKGDIVCMIEAMKLMNEVTMPEDGEIYFMAAEDGDMVEYDQILARYTQK